MAYVQPESGDDQKEECFTVSKSRLFSKMREQKESIIIDCHGQRSCRAMWQAAVTFLKNVLPH